MELSLTTFILEIVNFIVLVWVLKRFLFAPIKQAIEKRREKIEKSLSDAAQLRSDSEKMKAQYQSRLSDWETERETKLEVLKKEMAEEKERQLIGIQTAVNAERERLGAQEQKERDAFRKRQEEEAIRQSLQFLSTLLADFASQDLEAQIIRRVVSSLRTEESSEIAKLLEEYNSETQPLMVRSAFGLSQEQRANFLEAVKALLKEEPIAKFEVDHTLLAGVELMCGSIVLHADLRDELTYFSRAGQNVG